jgi:N-acetylneuraminic acid mutarotase
MKKFLLLLQALPVLLIAQGQWTQRANVPDNIGSATGFAVAGKGYIGLGYNPGVTKKFYRYDTLANTWTQVASFPGQTWGYAEGFAINGKGYVCVGQGTMTSQILDELWEYSPTADSWTQKANFGGGVRTEAASFVIGNKAYLGTGVGASGKRFNDLYEYDPALNTWTKKANFPGGKVFGASGFSIGNKGYIALGADTAGNFLSHIWEYDPALDTWTQKAPFPGGGRIRASAFSIYGRGYLGCGVSPSASQNDYYEYNPNTNSWTIVAAPGNLLRQSAVEFKLGNGVYMGTGGNQGSPYYNDFWKFSGAASGVGIPKIEDDLTCDFFPNPGTGVFHVVCSSNILSYRITDFSGKLILSKFPEQNESLHLKDLPPGLYFVNIEDIDHRQVQKKITISY